MGSSASAVKPAYAKTTEAQAESDSPRSSGRSSEQRRSSSRFASFGERLPSSIRKTASQMSSSRLNSLVLHEAAKRYEAFSVENVSDCKVIVTRNVPRSARKGGILLTGSTSPDLNDLQAISRATNNQCHVTSFNSELIPGKFLFLGPSNSGKSTLISLLSTSRMLPVLVRPDAYHVCAKYDFMLERSFADKDPTKSGGKRGSESERKSEALAQKQSHSQPQSRSQTPSSECRLLSQSLSQSECTGRLMQDEEKGGSECPETQEPQSSGQEKYHKKVLPLPPPSTKATNHQCCVSGYTFTAVDVPGRAAYKHAWYEDIEGVKAVVMVVDLCDSEKLDMAREEVKRLESLSSLDKLPVLILGNKLDKVADEMRSGHAIADANQLSKEIEADTRLRNRHGRMWAVRTCSAKDMQGVARALVWAVQQRHRGNA